MMPPREADKNSAPMGNNVNKATNGNWSRRSALRIRMARPGGINNSTRPAKWFRLTYGPKGIPPN